jgi:4-amino-4-deoxy-L-arabinose transferase-like glycosyltransferase
MRWRPRRDAGQLAGVALLALVVRVAYLAFASGSIRLHSDAAQYDALARHLAAGDGYVDTYPQLLLHATAFRPPGYPALLSVFYRVFGSSVGLARGLDVAIGVLVVVVAMLLARRELGHRAALATGLALALAPNLVANDTWVGADPLSLLLILALVRVLRDRRFLVAGLVTGLLVLVRPSAQPLPLLIGTWIVWRSGWRRVLPYVGVAVMVVAPWVVRNDIRLGAPVLVTSNGFNLAAMYGPPAQRIHAFVDPLHDPYYQSTRLTQFDEVEWDRTMRRIGLDNLRAHPAQVPRVVAANALATFELRPAANRNAERDDGRRLGVRNATLWVFWLTLAVGAVGLWRGRHEEVVQLVSGIGALFVLGSLFFVAPPRLRAPLDLALAFGVGVVFRRPRSARGDGTSIDGQAMAPDARSAAMRASS